MSRAIAGYGWTPDLPDFRDRHFNIAPEVLASLPASADLRADCPPVYDQGKLGSCTANAIGAALQFDQHKQHEKDFTPARLFIYYCERAMEGTVDTDSGAMIRDGIKCVNHDGAPPETVWSYDIAKFRERPSKNAYQQALLHQALAYQRIARSLNQMKGCLAAGFPFVFGFTVYESFESDQVAKTGTADLPAAGEAALGGHAVLAVGYDDATQRFTCRNSWGNTWGDAGYFTLPYAYLTDRGLASDFWTIRSVE
jgi:C1A family cysteine protease